MSEVFQVWRGWTHEEMNGCRYQIVAAGDLDYCNAVCDRRTDQLDPLDDMTWFEVRRPDGRRAPLPVPTSPDDWPF